MCGIFGAIGNIDYKDLKTSLERMNQRGPDSSKIIYFDNVCFAQNRLSIIAPSHEYDPPFVHNNKYFVFNGELYNFKELSQQAGITANRSDSLSAFEIFDKNKELFFNFAVGIFAFALFDSEKQTLTLVRDRLGKKPLYYTHQDGRFIFASSIDAITPHINPKFRKSALKSYLSYHAVIGEETFYEDIFKLPAGYTLEFDGKNIKLEKYFDFFTTAKHGFELEKQLTDSVSQRLISDAKLGAFLSGGLDSSTVCTIASDILRQSGKRLQTFCVGYDGYEKDDERAYARIVADKINSEHHEVCFNKNNFFDSLEKCITAFDEPISDPASLPLHFMSSVASSLGFKSVLSGEGGDEAFLGYDKYSLFHNMMKAKELPFSSYLTGYFVRHEEQNREWEWYRRIFADEIVYKSMAECFTDDQKIKLLNQKVSTQNSSWLIDKYHKEFLNSGFTDYTTWMSFIDIKIWLGEVLLQKADKIGMSCSLEIRCPLTDYKLLTEMVKIGDKRLGVSEKHMLKNIMSDRLPIEVISRAKKGFSYPFNKWLFESGDPEIVFELNKQTQFFHKRYLQFLFDHAKNGSFKHQFWSIYLFTKWFISRF